MNTDLRDARVLRAVREVMKRYEITEQPPAEADLRCFVLTGGSKIWQVQVNPRWQTPPHCD